MLALNQAGYEPQLAREFEAAGVAVVERGPGWVRLEKATAVEAFVFPHLTLMAPVELRGDTVNALAQGVADWFLASLRGERVDAAWPCVWQGPPEIVGLGRRITSVEAAFGEILRKKLARIAKLAVFELPRGVGPMRGLMVYFTDFGRVFVSREAYGHGQRRMADDALAPSRSYLKIEEAYIVLGREPAAGETVVDLGAAPGGWSYSAAKRGAQVIAIDNGPLKGGACDHPQIEHRREDAFKFAPPAGVIYDWLFCDMVEEPHNVLRNIIEPWLARHWCLRLVINLKFGRVDPLAFMRELRAPGTPLMTHVPGLRLRHLYHDREEFTLVGEVTA